MSSQWLRNLPLAFYANPEKARLLVATRKEANEIIMYYDGVAPTYIGLGQWTLVAKSMGTGAYELKCRQVKD